jgi:hypothetical protein
MSNEIIIKGLCVVGMLVLLRFGWAVLFFLGQVIADSEQGGPGWGGFKEGSN